MIKVPLPRVLAARGFATRDYGQGLYLGKYSGGPVIFGSGTFPSFLHLQPRAGNEAGGLVILPKGTALDVSVILTNSENLDNCGYVEQHLLDDTLYIARGNTGSGKLPSAVMFQIPKLLPSGAQLGDSGFEWDQVWTTTLRGILKTKVTTYLSTSNISVQDHYVEAYANDADITLHLPDPRECEGKEIVVKKVAGDYDVIVDVASGDDIDGEDSVTLHLVCETYVFFSRYGHWAIKSHYTA